MRKAGQIAAGVVIDLGIEVLIEKLVGGHATFSDAFDATGIGCSEVMSAIGDNTFKSKIGGFIWEASKPAVSYVIDTPSEKWSWNGMGTKVEAGIQSALFNELLGRFANKFLKSIKKHPSINNNAANANGVIRDLNVIIKKDPAFIKDLYNAIYKWSKLHSRMPEAKKLLQNNKVYDYLEKVKKPTLGLATTNNHIKTFDDAFPEIVGDIYQRHHAFPQTLLNKYPNLFKDKAIHSFENLRGIPKNDKTIHGTITGRWTTFLNSGTKPYKDIEDFAKSIDDEFGHRFLPPIR